MIVKKKIMRLVACLFGILLLMLPAPAQADTGVWRLINPTEYTAFPASNMHGVYMLSGGISGKGSGNGWAVSDNGFIFHWDGFSWNQAAAPVNNCQLNSVNFGGPLNPLTPLSSSSGWIVGGVGGGGACAPGKGVSFFFNGVAWVEYPIPSPAPATTELRGVFLVRGGPSGTSVQAYAVGTESGADGAFWVWNGVPGAGGAWTRCAVAGCGGVVGAPVNSLYMTGADDGIAVANGGALYRFFGGLWGTRPSPVAVDLNGVAMASRTNGWAVGDSCTIIRTTDGDTWTGPLSPAGCTANLRSVILLSASEGWAVGDADASGATILHGTSLDSAPVWTRLPANQVATILGLNSITFASSGGNLWAVGQSGVAAFCLSNCSSPSGAIWSTTTSPQDDFLNSVFMVGNDDGWAVGNPDGSGNPTILRWNGATFSWTRAPIVTPITSPTFLFGAYLASSTDGWAVGATSGTVASTLYYDGNRWTGRPVPACSCFLNSVYMVSSSNSWAVGTGGVIMHSTSPGGIFGISPSIITTDLYSVYFEPTSGGMIGWAVGGDGVNPPVIVRTSNGGADAWPLVANPAAAGVILQSVFFQDSTHGWAVGSGSTILYWNGISWTNVPVIVSPPFTAPLSLFGIAVLGGPPATDGWAVGQDAAGLPVMVHYDAATWKTIPLTPSIPSTGILFGLSIRSSTNGLAVGTQILGSPLSLALIIHLDPPAGVIAGTTQTVATSSSATSTPIVTSSSTSVFTATTNSLVTIAATSESSSATAAISSSVHSSSSTAGAGTATLESSTASMSTTPLTLPSIPIPAFPLESILAGIVIGFAALGIARRRRRLSFGSPRR